MAEYRGIDLLDFFVVLAKNKRFFVVLGFVSLIVSYLLIYFLIPPRFDSSALIVGAESNPLNPVSQISRSITKLPLSALGFQSSSKLESYDLFTTFIYSRTNLDDMIKKFGLMKAYNVDRIELARKILGKSISVNITEQSAYAITVGAGSPQTAADMCNYLVDKINKAVIDLNVKKSKENNQFLKERYHEIKKNLSDSEDSLKLFQQKSGILEPENQVKASIEEYSSLEAELAKKQIELSVIEKIFGSNSTQAKNSAIGVEEFHKKLNSIKSSKDGNSLLVSINHLPSEVLKYARLYRDVKINETMLEYIIPLYEQSKFEEVKNIPVLQVIDHAVPPDKKSYPPRTIFTILLTFFVLVFVLIIMTLKQYLDNTANEKLKYIKNEIFRFSKRK